MATASHTLRTRLLLQQTTPPADASPAPPVIEPARRSRVPAPRRGRMFTMPPAPAVAAAPAWVPSSSRARRPPQVARRGEFLPPPLAGATPAPPPPFPPPYLEQTHTRPTVLRRGRFLTVPMVGATPPPQAPPPLRLLSTRRRPQPNRPRGIRFLPPPYTVLPAAPSVWRPPTIRAAPRRAARRQARGQYLPLYLVGLPPPSYVPVYVGVDNSTTAAGALGGTGQGAGLDGSSGAAGSLGGSGYGSGLDGHSQPAGMVE